MKTILSLTTLATVAAFLGLLPWAQGESKESGKRAKSLPAPGEKVSLAKVELPKTTVSGQAKAPSKTKAASSKQSPKESPAKTSSLSASDSPVADSRTTKEDKPTKSSSKKLPEEPAKLPLTESQEGKLLTLLNEGTFEDLDAIPGIAATRADSIVSARPYGSVHEIILVEGVGNATFEKILAYGKTLTQRSVSPAAGSRKS